jgi:hypothetical protein
VKQFVAQKLITEMEHLPCSPDLAPNDFWMLPDNKVCLKQTNIWNIEVVKKNRWHQKLFQNRGSKNVSSSGSIIIGQSAELLMVSVLKVTPLSKLEVHRYACNKIIPETS